MSDAKTEKIVYEFRPLPDFFAGEFRRYAEGGWIPDDGEYDLAFIGKARVGYYSCCLMVEARGHEGILCAWLTTHWTENVSKHPKGNPWHYALREGFSDWGLSSDHNSENRRAGDSGMSKMASECGASNGSHVEFNIADKHIAAGLLRNRETKEVFVWPEGMKCMYCGLAPSATNEESRP